MCCETFREFYRELQGITSGLVSKLNNKHFKIKHVVKQVKFSFIQRCSDHFLSLKIRALCDLGFFKNPLYPCPCLTLPTESSLLHSIIRLWKNNCCEIWSTDTHGFHLYLQEKRKKRSEDSCRTVLRVGDGWESAIPKCERNKCKTLSKETLDMLVRNSSSPGTKQLDPEFHKLFTLHLTKLSNNKLHVLRYSISIRYVYHTVLFTFT